jgi:hypothetical protein
MEFDFVVSLISPVIIGKASKEKPFKRFPAVLAPRVHRAKATVLMRFSGKLH